jgi:hypothetical protein
MERPAGCAATTDSSRPCRYLAPTAMSDDSDYEMYDDDIAYDEEDEEIEDAYMDDVGTACFLSPRRPS